MYYFIILNCLNCFKSCTATAGPGKRSARGKNKSADAQSGKEQVETHVQNLCTFAWEWGLTKSQLRIVVELFTKHQLRTKLSADTNGFRFSMPLTDDCCGLSR